jgi:hypothetical protein
VIQLEPKHAKAHYKPGLSHMRMGMIREAFAEISNLANLLEILSFILPD